jgi:DNA-binding SARP family transcriptional activator/tetratricopeptide (TPR) repeat protein
MLRVSVLGGQQISSDRDGGAQVRSSRALALVAYLAAHAGVPHARQQIAGLLWPESGDAQALTNLRRELHHLRQVLGGDCSLQVTARDLCWTDVPTCVVDVRVFDIERAAALAAIGSGDDVAVIEHGGNAIAQYRGDLLPGVYDDWLTEDRARLERQCVELCDLVSAARARAGDLAGAVIAARRRIELQPLEEVGYRVLMGLQADMGDRAAAVTTYHHCASVLERELGVVPDDATRAAFQRLMAQPGTDPAAGPRASGSTAAGATPAARTPPAKNPVAGRPGQPRAPLIGRSAELGALRAIWQAAAAGRPGAVLVEGGPGVGKTRLVSEVAELARQQGAIVVSTQCFAAPGRLALAPVADWLRDPAVQAAAATLNPAWRAEVARLVPDRSTAAHDPTQATMANAWQRHRFFEGLARALLAVNRPLLLVLDNVHWCDQETLDFITFCLGLAGDGSRLLVAGTVREDHRRGDRDLASWAVRMRAAGLLTELPLSPLGAADAAALAQAISGQPLAPEDTATLHATTGGFPLYVIEATRGGVGAHGGAAGISGDGGSGGPLPPGDLSAVLRRRLAQASPAAQEVAGLAAAVGTNFSLDLLTEASDLAADGVVAAVDELWRSRILREFGTGYDFSHDLLRDAAYAEVTPARRWLLHRRIAQGLELLHAGDTDPVAARLAAQYARAGGQAKAVAYYRRATQVATGRFAHAEAVRLCRAALSVIKTMAEGRSRDSLELSVLTELAAPLNATEGYASRALERDLQRSIVLAESLGRDDQMQTGLVALSTVWFVQGRTADSHQVASRALALASPGSSAAGQARFILGGAAIHMGRPEEGLRHLAVAAGLGDGMELLRVGTRANVHATAWGAHAHWLLGDDATAIRASSEAVDKARAIGDPYNLAIALAYSAVTHQMRHDLLRLRDVVAELLELCKRFEFAYYREWALILDGWSTGDGKDTGGTRLAEVGIGNLKAQGAFARQPYWLSLLADLQAREGRPGAASATLDAALTAGHAHDDRWWLPEVMRMRAGFDPPEQAVARLRAAVDLAAGHGSVALVRRCEDELRQLGIPSPSTAP